MPNDATRASAEALPNIPRPTIEAEIERLIALLDAMDPDQDLEENGDLEPSLGWSPDNRSYIDAGDDREGDWSDDEPTMGAIEAMLGAPLTLFGGRMHGLFPALREPGHPLTYASAGFCQLAAWSGPTDALTDESEPVCEDEGAQCDDEGAHTDNGIGDWDGLSEVYARACGTFG